MLERYPQVVRWTRASGTTGGKGEVPSLAKEGWPRHQVNGPVPLEARPGWFVQLPMIGGLNQPPRLRPLKEASRHFLNGRSHPSLSKEGTSAFPSVVFNAPVSGKRCGTWQAKTDNPVPPLRAGQTSVWRLLRRGLESRVPRPPRY